MNIQDLEALTHEVQGYRSSGNHVECMQRMNQYEKETTDPEVRAVLLISEASSALELQKVISADEALSKIDIDLLPHATQNLVNIMKASAAHLGGRLAEADKLLSMILATNDVNDEDQRDVLYEALAMKGFVQADLNQFGPALVLLDMASSITGAEGYLEKLSESIDVYRAYCLQGSGRLDEAEACLKNLLKNTSLSIKADAYYRLGAIELQKEEFAAARADFLNALTNFSRGRLHRKDILSALREAEDKLARPF